METLYDYFVYTIFEIHVVCKNSLIRRKFDYANFYDRHGDMAKRGDSTRV